MLEIDREIRFQNLDILKPLKFFNLSSRRSRMPRLQSGNQFEEGLKHSKTFLKTWDFVVICTKISEN